ncbi:unnamed protein product [Prorocentrum cordatum]|uniref:Uncharacterized protein n=1 Tax=Prorocentrum cordatum TaxID=2364126 RepID=A0ABN9UD99_9DINO|nr:unnamed protein product [Polarella glacialis]
MLLCSSRSRSRPPPSLLPFLLHATLKDSTDLDHPCRIPGSVYLKCLQDSVKTTEKNRSAKCLPLFGTFDACRRGVIAQQKSALENSLVKQDIADRRAKALFERRAILLDTKGH